ncbi:diguanylate cyclase [Rhizobium sp. LjRoot98]|uniref:sensor domain-containing diguanylate cyclase n=1 Tax=unclassified Rhizobium TaxID=2613769 RepID=UPI000713C309|nr:diguanylate cyclase [Rhizobium sp. Root1204]KQV41509.1 hypothetical protein ASC96_16960 [Rhizobium sp. Root1204]
MTRFTHLKLVAPAIMLISVLIAGLAAIPYYGVASLDGEIRERQETLVKRNISIWIADVEFALTAWTIWDESIAKIDNAFDPVWTDRNIGSSLIGTSRTRFVAILDAKDGLIYQKTAPEVQGRVFFQRGAKTIANDSRALVDRIRQIERRERARGIPERIAVSKIEVVGNDAVLLTASLFQPDFKTAMPRGDRAPILISAIPIAGSLQEFFGSRFLLDDAMVGPLNAVRSGRARAEIAVGPDGKSEVLSWRSPTPARDLFHQSLPLAATVAMVLIAGGVFAMRTTRRALASLVEAEQRMRHAATHDFLTGLANRSLVAPEFERLSANGSVIVACIDLDGFKLVNDTHGHAAGDELLRQVAGRLRAGCLDSDVVFRLGGDEFVILMAGVPLREAEWRCRQLSSALSQSYSLGHTVAVVGASFGVEEIVAGSAESCDAALRRADEALYLAKAKGRGKVVAAPHLQAGAIRSCG